MAPADVEWVLGVVRAGRDYQGMESAKSGGPGYEFTATIIVRGKTAEIVGGAGRLTPILAKQIEVALCSHGITTAIWERFCGDPKKIVRATRGRTSSKDEHGGATCDGQDHRRPDQGDFPESMSDDHAAVNHHPGVANLEALGLAAARFASHGHAHDHTAARNGHSHGHGHGHGHGSASTNTPHLNPVVRQKAASR